MQFHQRPDLSGASEAVSLSATRQRVSAVPVELTLPNQQVLLGFPNRPPPIDAADDGAFNKAVFMTNAMRKHPDVRENQILFAIFAVVNILFTSAFLLPADAYGHAWYDVGPLPSQLPNTWPGRLALLASTGISLVCGAYGVFRKHRFILLLFLLYTAAQDALLVLYPPVFLLVLRIPIDVILGGLAYRIHAALSARWFVTSNKK
ncbi:hypothetical protein SPRG_05880 [Saprolegnia parasitica CBS 223.65]|uniref:Uncharacterized protein n=1 Tax=Saprolegnia parasitica (strain CBS 223.65) TaxID=695850 RepID=A0A067CF13_SAPPC|nr:hypothetical protein SPRG_05880 [Saprolegnia parasitica CBS 223.65]KDO29344.1 hypothetical protein SPRG_05880 [Saprolegnia parasitica CBS 223.65]|eukprot:XP_012199847.1 hypothetical protein SPRG_05880 [Saprolegnia parasitica CBS 223.65]